MIDIEKFNVELEKFTLEEVLNDSEKLDKLFKLYSIKQALVQIKQAEEQTKFFEYMSKAQDNVDSNLLNDFLKDNSIQDLMNRLSNIDVKDDRLTNPDKYVII